MIPQRVKIKHGALPDVPGVYIMKSAAGKVIYVGKASSLKRRVNSYFQRPHDTRIQRMVSEIAEIDYIEKPTAIEALILEANLIKHYYPSYNIKDKDNKSFLYLVITREDFPKPLLVRGSELGDDLAKQYKAVFGPYTSPRALRAALDLARKAIPWSTCEAPAAQQPTTNRPASGGTPPSVNDQTMWRGQLPTKKRACFYFHLKLCPGVCVGAISKKDYAKIIRDLIKFFDGKKDDLLKRYKGEMKTAAKEHRYEEAAELRNKIYNLEHIQDIAILKREDDQMDKIREGEAAVDIFGRIEGYDISNISGTFSVGSMVVFQGGASDKREYRKFRIKSVVGPNDVACLKETLARRFRNPWKHPDLILVDGGAAQVNAALSVVREWGLGIPVVGLAKGPARDKDELICGPNNFEACTICRRNKALLVAVRDEAHRFALAYHRKLRGKKMLGM